MRRRTQVPSDARPDVVDLELVVLDVGCTLPMFMRYAPVLDLAVTAGRPSAPGCHATASRLVGIGITSAHSKSSRSTVCVGHEVREPERLDRALARAGAAVAQLLDHVRRDRRARELDDLRRRRPRTDRRPAAGCDHRGAPPATAWPRRDRRR